MFMDLNSVQQTWIIHIYAMIIAVGLQVLKLKNGISWVTQIPQGKYFSLKKIDPCLKILQFVNPYFWSLLGIVCVLYVDIFNDMFKRSFTRQGCQLAIRIFKSSVDENHW